MTTESRSIVAAAIFGVAIVGSTAIAAGSYRHRFGFQDTIRVTGSAEQNFTSDLIVWSASFSRKSMDLKATYASLKDDESRIREYLTKHGVKAEEIVFSAVQINKDFSDKFDEKGNRVGQEFAGFRLQQTVRVESREIDKVEKISRESTELIQTGVELESSAPDFYYTKLSELKIGLLGSAAADAKLRAETVARSTGAKLGRLKNASVGIFQITGQNSGEAYTAAGAFNLVDKNKSAQITIRTEFEAE